MSKSERANHYADLIIDCEMTIREVAKYCGVSKSTVYEYVTNNTTGIIRKFKLKRQLKKNQENWWIKGGLATKKKYSKMK